MDRKTIIKKLNPVFYKIGQESKRYSKVWLEDLDFGGLYHSKKFILHAQVQHPIEDSLGEIKYVLYLLEDEVKEARYEIFRVAIHEQYEEIDCDSRYMVYEEEEACS